MGSLENKGTVGFFTAFWEEGVKDGERSGCGVGEGGGGGVYTG